MKQILCTLLYSLLITACSADVNEHSDKPLVKSEKQNKGLAQQDDCDIDYDTIKDDQYKMHLVILDKFYNPQKRGYAFDANGDTLNYFLYHQDIAVFANGLDSTEDQSYKKLTNKVVFLILEHEPKMLDYGLTQWTTDLKELDYFMYHVSNPVCDTLPIDRIAARIKLEMGEPHKAARQVKQELLKNLEMAKRP